MSADRSIAAVNWLEPLIKFVFSWVILMPIAVIISGKLLAKPIRLSVTSKQNFEIPLRILTMRATGGEVVLGFTSFIVMLLLVGVFFGQAAYALVKTNFGIDPGQFNALCMLSSFISVAISFLIFIADVMFKKRSGSGIILDPAAYEKTISELAAKKEV
jgi:hypothetical protein